MTEPKKIPTNCKPRFRIMAGKEIALGPGKIDLMETIDKTGSISSAAKDMGLSYRRAWGMVDTMNSCFKSPLVERSKGGKGGGGATLTPLGEKIVTLYRSMESKAIKVGQPDWNQIKSHLKKT